MLLKVVELHPDSFFKHLGTPFLRQADSEFQVWPRATDYSRQANASAELLQVEAPP